MSTLVFVEHHDGEPLKGSLGVLSKAVSLGAPVSAVVLGAGARAAAEHVGAYGAQTVYVADTPELAAPLPQPRVDVLADLVRSKGVENVVLSSSVLGTDLAAGLAARLDAGLNWGLVDLSLDGGRLVGKQSALGDSVYVDVAWTTTTRLALVRSGAFEPVRTGGSATIEEIPATIQDWSVAATLVSTETASSEGPSIEDAVVIVAGGRGLGGPEHFGVVEELAKALGGAVAATRAVVDAGWYPYSTQVGQTGKNVSPKLYVACGISGAIQHKVGMQNSGTIVAINKDKNAPIFDYCDLGIVGDLHAVVPKLTELVKQRKSS
ncbi:MAG: electron transfer flavoprotein subunit alpha/FixB family protein [Thermoleophilia bacterium]